VGQTKRQLKTRVREHFSNLNSKSANPSVITEHILQTSHSFDWDNGGQNFRHWKKLFQEVNLWNDTYQRTISWSQRSDGYRIARQCVLWYSGEDLHVLMPVVFTKCFHCNNALVFIGILLTPPQYTQHIYFVDSITVGLRLRLTHSWRHYTNYTITHTIHHMF